LKAKRSFQFAKSFAISAFRTPSEAFNRFAGVAMCDLPATKHGAAGRDTGSADRRRQEPIGNAVAGNRPALSRHWHHHFD